MCPRSYRRGFSCGDFRGKGTAYCFGFLSIETTRRVKEQIDRRETYGSRALVQRRLRQGRIEIPDLDFLFPSVAEQKLKALEINSKKAVVQGYFNPRNFSIFSPAGVTAFSAATPFKVENTNNRVERNGPSRVEAGKVYL